MPILNVQIDTIGQAGQVPKFIYLNTNDSADDVIQTGYLNGLIDQGIPLSESLMALVTTKNDPDSRSVQTGLYGISYSNGNWSLVDEGEDSSGNVNVQIFSTPGSYTYEPTLGMKSCLVQVVGAGGSGGGALGAIPNRAGAGGGSGGYAQKVFSADEIGTSQPVVVGTGAVSAAGASGDTGGVSYFGNIVCGGGFGGPNDEGAAGGSGGLAVGGDINCDGNAGTYSFVTYGTSFGDVAYAGSGAPSFFGGSAFAVRGNSTSGDVNGNGGGAYGAGGGGAFGYTSTKTGGPGANGLVLVTEYL